MARASKVSGFSLTRMHPDHGVLPPGGQKWFATLAHQSCRINQPRVNGFRLRPVGVDLQHWGCAMVGLFSGGVTGEAVYRSPSHRPGIPRPLCHCTTSWWYNHLWTVWAVLEQTYNTTHIVHRHC